MLPGKERSGSGSPWSMSSKAWEGCFQSRKSLFRAHKLLRKFRARGLGLRV